MDCSCQESILPESCGIDVNLGAVQVTHYHRLILDSCIVAANCPVCSISMDTFPYAGPGAVVIDHCRQCDAIWIDAGELTQIEQAPGVR